MLERVAMHQTRLRVPGLGIDAKGVVLGSKGLVLLASLERLVAFLSLYTSERSLGDLVGNLRVEVVRSKMNTREVVLSFPAQNSESLDLLAEVARLALGHTFTGSSRHFVQFRDASAPFGFDAAEVIAADADYVLYHSTFTQTYVRDRDIDLTRLLLRLRPQLDPSTARDPGPLWVLAEEGLGPAWIQYLIRSRVGARVGLAEWPPASALDEAPVRRHLFHVPELPARMLPLARTTPGLTVFRSVAPGAAVELGWRHPVNLQACPVFSGEGLVLFRGHGLDALTLARLPAMGEVESFARVSFGAGNDLQPARVLDRRELGQVTVPIRLAPSMESYRDVRGSFIAPGDLPVLRKVLYGLGPSTLRQAKIAFAREGALLVFNAAADTVPVGTFLRELRPGVFVAAGFEPVPTIAPDVLFRALGAPPESTIVLLPDRGAIGFPNGALVALQDALIEAQAWAPVDPAEIAPALDAEVPVVEFEPLGLRPMAGVSQAAEKE